MIVKSVNWIDEDSREAEVVNSDGYNEVLCFSQPFEKFVNDAIKEPIYCLDVENLMLAKEYATCINKSGSHFGYFLRGKLIDAKLKLICLENIYTMLR